MLTEGSKEAKKHTLDNRNLLFLKGIICVFRNLAVARVRAGRLSQ